MVAPAGGAGVDLNLRQACSIPAVEGNANGPDAVAWDGECLPIPQVLKSDFALAKWFI